MIIEGRAWVAGDDLSVTDLVPARYDPAAMSHDWAECGRHVLEDVLGERAAEISAGDLVVARSRIGSGHAHYFGGAIRGLRERGVAGLFATNVSVLFLRAAVDAGLPVWAIPQVGDLVADGDTLRVDLTGGIATNVQRAITCVFPPTGELVAAILGAGGSEAWALSRLDAGTATPGS